MKHITYNATAYANILTRLGGGIARYSVAAIFLAYGIFKFTAVEANAIAPLTENSPFLFWLNDLLGRQGGANLIGTMEIIIAAMIAARFQPDHFSARQLGCGWCLDCDTVLPVLHARPVAAVSGRRFPCQGPDLTGRITMGCR